MPVIDLQTKQPRDTGGEPPNNGGMESRVAKLEATSEKTAQLLADIRSDLSILKAVSATKEELHKAINEQTWKLITWTTGLGLALVTAVFFIARNVR